MGIAVGLILLGIIVALARRPPAKVSEHAMWTLDHVNCGIGMLVSAGLTSIALSMIAKMP